MTDTARTEDSSLLSIAAAIARGEPVDWSSMHAEDPETTTILGELRSLEGLSRVGQPVPDAWGPYTITGEIGHGSYGTVYRALDKDLGLELALKVIRPRDPGDQAAATVALQEARLLAQITHPNVVRIYGAERVGSEVGIAMELVQGQTLHRVVAAQGPFSANETMLLGGDLCRAVAAVHGARLLHGDIKANNVMRAQGGRTVLMDFGAGRDLKSAPSRSKHAAGTPLYLAPEVLSGGPPTVASDIYSIGVLLFYLATGTYPVHGHTRTDVEQQHLSRAPRRLLRDVRPDLPESFIHIVERATAERPEDRYATAGELEAALARAIRSEEQAPVHSKEINRWPLAVAAAVAAAVAVAVIGLAYRAGGPSPGTSSPTITAAASTAADPPPATPAAASDAYEVEAAFYRQDGGTPVRLQPGARVAPGELLSLQIRSSVPSWVYVVNEDEKGDSFLLFPLPGQQLTNPLPPGRLHEIPGVVNGERLDWQVSSAGGREHFLVFVTPQEPSRAFERMFAALPPPEVGATVTSHQMNNDLVTALRGVGGLAKTPARPGTAAPLSREYAVPLPAGAETARGVWIRQLTLENPVR
jgi:eukaryotic-like serine/threonine-protein kinase